VCAWMLRAAGGGLCKATGPALCMRASESPFLAASGVRARWNELGNALGTSGDSRFEAVSRRKLCL
jgi:hypothetical protein